MDNLKELSRFDLLERVWPSDRVLLGMRVCKWMHAELSDIVESVYVESQSTRNFRAFNVRDMRNTLVRLSKNSVTLKCKAGIHTSQPIVNGIVGAVKQGFGPAVRHLILAIDGPYNYDGATGQMCGIGPTGSMHLAVALQRCLNLLTLDLSCNKIGDAGAEKLGKVLGELPELRHLRLAENSLESKGATKLAEGLRRCTRLVELGLAQNKIGLEGAQALAPSLDGCPQLEQLDMRRNWITDEGASLLFAACSSSISRLNLHETHISSVGVRAMASHMPLTNALSHLDLENNSLQHVRGRDIASFLEQCHNLTYLNLSRCRLANTELELGACAQLEHILLADNQLSEGLSLLMQAGGLRECSALLELDMHSNDLERASVRSLIDLAEALPSWPLLARLDLSRNNLSSDIIALLADRLSLCPLLSSLDLSFNLVSLPGAGALARSLPRWTLLAVLRLQRASLVRQGVAALLPSLRQCPSLHELNLLENQVCHSDAAHLHAEIQRAIPQLASLQFAIGKPVLIELPP
mmetsp:Transcript_20602/g.41854  ORF Transcript_20602/g.41854 Transcript_20602/m.41854 type:complete len:524 (-) Transcript_20602:209-1780(-)|eukprot:CAMPEP_0181324606 /NCGR_PEP_ID=MMETSP1101-20121128/20454_1 /TAXON_ID=46948 /ORGANISM="Rhodomonas abbreviata, Strain Caron Lab Isolate" /LENGTH=523 /DNA_ID=CAMNT_0023432803 /DNA_START=68 /DNA_END=1642 /DNA_ORIENTATION=+